MRLLTGKKLISKENFSKWSNVDKDNANVYGNILEAFTKKHYLW